MLIVLIEDSPELSQLIVDTLEMDGHQVLVGTNGSEGLCLLEANPHADLLITDLKMPHMDGIELLRRIRQDPRWNALRCVVMSGSTGDRALVKNIGADGFLPKPFSYPDFHAIMQSVMRR